MNSLASGPVVACVLEVHVVLWLEEEADEVVEMLLVVGAVVGLVEEAEEVVLDVVVRVEAEEDDDEDLKDEVEVVPLDPVLKKRT